MDKTQIVITETFLTNSEAERKERLQKAVDLYLYHQLQNGCGAADGAATAGAGAQPRREREWQE